MSAGGIRASRCPWCGDDPLYVDYHDREWGEPSRDDAHLFEMLVLEGAQAGLSWLTILRKRENYRRAFDGFDPERMARYGEAKVRSLLADAGIVRNRLKIAAAIDNARAFLAVREARGAFAPFAWSFVDGVPRRNAWRSMSQVPAATPESDRMSRELKRLGFRFVGSTICYAFMQSVGMVNDHLVGCFRHRQIRPRRMTPVRPRSTVAARLGAAVLTALVATASAAQQSRPVTPDVPPAARIDEHALNQAVRAALACAASNLLARSATNDMNLVVQPYLTKKVVGYAEYRTNEVRYAEKPVREPVYKDEYEEYEELQTQSGESAVDRRQLKKVKLRRLVSRKIVGSNTVMRLVPDPSGPIVKRHVQPLKPIYDDAPDYWTAGFLMQNAMALLALRKCGIEETDPGLSRLADTLRNLIATYGIPDTTWDVAWLAAAFANMHGKAFDEIRTQLISKILDGQITADGPARGLWGPVCINLDLLAAMIAHEQALSADVAKMKARGGEDGGGRKQNQALVESEARLAAFIDEYALFSQQGLRFASVTNEFTNRGRPNMGAARVVCRGLPYNIYREAFADIECTAMALFAIRQAAENGYLPKETLRPQVDRTQGVSRPAAGGKPRKTPLLPPEETDRILARAVAAVTARQRPDGTWDECIVQQPVHAFNALGIGGAAAGDGKEGPNKAEKRGERATLDRLQTKDVPPWTSRETLLASAQGCASLFDAGAAVGINKLLGRYAAHAEKAQQWKRKASEGYLNGSLPPGVDIGGRLDPYDFVWALGGIQRDHGGTEQDRRDLWQRLAWRLMQLHGANGMWNCAGGVVYPPCLWAKREAEQKAAREKSQAHLPAKDRKPLDPADARKKSPWQRPHDWANGDVLATCRAMLFLLEGVRPPVAGYVAAPGVNSARSTVAKAMELLAETIKTPTDWLRVSVDAPAGAKALPLLYASGGSLQTPQGQLLAREYLQATQGVLVVETTPSAALESALLPLVPGGTPVEISANNSGVLRNFRGPLPNLRGIARKDNRWAVVFLPVSMSEPTPPGQLGRMAAAQLVSLLAQDRLPPGLSDPRYPIAPGDRGDPFALRAQAMDLLQRLAAGEAMPGAARPPSSGPAATNRPAAARGADSGSPGPQPPPGQEPKPPRADETW